MSTRLSTEELDAIETTLTEQRSIVSGDALALVAEVRASWADAADMKSKWDAEYDRKLRLEKELRAARRALRDLIAAIEGTAERTDEAVAQFDAAMRAARAELSEKERT